MRFVIPFVAVLAVFLIPSLAMAEQPLAGPGHAGGFEIYEPTALALLGMAATVGGVVYLSFRAPGNRRGGRRAATARQRQPGAWPSTSG